MTSLSFRTVCSVVSLILLSTLWGCARSPVTYDYDPGIDFVAFKSYRWLVKDHTGREDPRIKNDLMDQRIKEAINDTLARRNYVKREDKPVDFLITYQLGIEKKTEVDRVGTGIGFGYRFAHLGFRTDTVVREHNEITLYIDMIDPKTQKLIWRGMRSYRYQSGGTVAERQARIREIVGEILSGFPPRR